MKKQILTFCIIAFYVTFGNAQTVGRIPKYLTSNTFDDSQIFQSGTNVGIGTTTIGQKFTVNGNCQFISDNSNHGLQILGNGVVPARRGISLDNDPSGKFNFYIHSWQTNASFNFIDGNNLSQVLMSIGANGNVGIGTSTSTDKLTVKKDQNSYTYISVDNNYSVPAAGVGEGIALTENNAIAWYMRAERDGTGKFNIGSGSGTNRLTINNVGNIGIGTSSPLEKLNVFANSGNAYIRTEVNNGSGSYRSYTFGTNTTDYNLHIRDAVGGWDIITGNYSNGNVGIGTTSPAEKLDVNGKISFRRPDDGASAGSIGFISPTNLAIKSWGGSGIICFYASNIGGSSASELMRIGMGGVGIGTTNIGSYQLAVNGTIHAKEIVVDLIGWSDFIFAKDYQLKPLAEVESYINKHQHLPDVPSAKEVSEKGINLGAMDAVLLQKIEELTLYTILLQKQVDEMKTQLINK